MSMAIEGLYRPLWSEAILQEPHRHEQRKLVDRGTNTVAALAAVDKLLGNLRERFDDAVVSGWEPWRAHTGFLTSMTSTWSRPPLWVVQARS